MLIQALGRGFLTGLAVVLAAIGLAAFGRAPAWKETLLVAVVMSVASTAFLWVRGHRLSRH